MRVTVSWIGDVVARTLTRKAVGKVMKSAGSLTGGALTGKTKVEGSKNKASAEKGNKCH